MNRFKGEYDPAETRQWKRRDRLMAAMNWMGLYGTLILIVTGIIGGLSFAQADNLGLSDGLRWVALGIGILSVSLIAFMNLFQNKIAEYCVLDRVDASSDVSGLPDSVNADGGSFDAGGGCGDGD
ncbi:MAG: hypothetical protein KY468_08675 [Armatimonadetes bacterium]|nr:hypothetical protein [Armatimonadota bacterium]